jgi:protein TilB
MTTVSPQEPPKRYITLELIRKRSEHNAGLVSSLEELALHQEELQAVGPILGRTCGKTLRILLLQNNVIERMVAKELKLFKRLEYFNLALNNIHCIEQGSLSGMESLRKLDLTLNFIDLDCLETSADELGRCQSLKELFLIGNPCMGLNENTNYTLSKELNAVNSGAEKSKKGWSGCRAYIIARLPNLQLLDGMEIKRSERIIAMQQVPALTAQLRQLAQDRDNERQLLQQMKDGSGCNEDKSTFVSDEAMTKHDPETRTKISNELHARKMAKEKHATENTLKCKGEKELEEEHREVVGMERSRGNDKGSSRDVKQCNQGKYNFWFDEEPSNSGIEYNLVLRVDIPKHLSTSLIDVDVHPTYVSIVIKNKILRVLLPVEVILDGTVARRSAASGNLELVMPKMNPKEMVVGLTDARAKNARDKAPRNNAAKMSSSFRKREYLSKVMMEEVENVAINSSEV